MKENNIPETIQELYEVFGKISPYAADAVAYYIFGSKESDNKVGQAIRGVYAKPMDASEMSKCMLDYEYNWQYHMEEIETFFKNLIGDVY